MPYLLLSECVHLDAIVEAYLKLIYELASRFGVNGLKRISN